MASKFWVGGGTNTNWNSSPVTNWANTSGGAGNQTAPATGDDVTFDNNSGTGASVWNTSISLNSLVCTGGRNTVTHSSGVTITISGGNLALPGGVGATYTPGSSTALFSITGTTGTQTITFNGKNMAALTLNGVGGTFQTQDAGTVTNATNAGVVTLTNGTFDTQTFALSMGSFSSNNSNTRVLKGSGAWGVLVTNASPWTVNTSGLTTTNFTSQVTISGTMSAIRTFSAGGMTFQGGLVIAANSSVGGIDIAGANTFASFSASGPNLVAFNANQVFSAAPTITATPAVPVTFCSDAIGTQRTHTVSAGNIAFTGVALRDTIFSGGTNTATDSLDLGRNSGITITPPVAGPIGHQCM